MVKYLQAGGSLFCVFDRGFESMFVLLCQLSGKTIPKSQLQRTESGGGGRGITS